MCVYPRLSASQCAGLTNPAIPRLQRDEVKFYRSATQQRLVITMASELTIRTQQQRVDVLKRLDAGHSCRAVAIELGCACGKTQIVRIIAQPLVSSTSAWRSCSCHPTQPHAMFLVVCMCACSRMRACVCV